MLSDPLPVLDRATAPRRREPRSRAWRTGAAALLLVAALIGVVALLRAWWPAGVGLGLVVGVVAVLVMGWRMATTAALEREDVDLAQALGLEMQAQPAPQEAGAAASAVAAPSAVQQPAAAIVAGETQHAVATVPADPDAVVRDPGVRADLARLRAELGDDYDDFGRAARLVVSTQYASAARLQRELELPYSRARRLLADLESEHFVGPPTGSRPRVVLMPVDRLPEIERLFADV